MARPPPAFDVAPVQNMTELCFGGSFNPIHVGHLILARTAAEAGGFSKVILIPSAQPPHKQAAADLAAAADRLEMARLVAAHDSLFEVSDIESRRDGPSFTLDTVRQIKAAGTEKVAWLIGEDQLRLLPEWHRATELLREVQFIVVRRPGDPVDWSALPAEFQSLKGHVVTAPLLEVSGQAIRQRVREGLSIRYMVTSEVERYILERGLYRT